MRHEPATDELPVVGKTVELPTAEPAARQQPATAGSRSGRGGFWRELAGALAAGAAVLAVVVLVLQVVAWTKGMPGLGAVVLIGHVVGAVLAIAAQRMVDRSQGRPALVAALCLGAVVAAILLLFWWI